MKVLLVHLPRFGALSIVTIRINFILPRLFFHWFFDKLILVVATTFHLSDQNYQAITVIFCLFSPVDATCLLGPF